MVDRAAALFTEILTTAGYAVADLPAGDIQIQGIVDLGRGRAFSTQSALHPHGDGAPDLTRVMNDALSQMSAKFSSDVVAALTPALASGDHVAAAAALEHAAGEGQLAFSDASVLKAAQGIDVVTLPSDAEKATRLIRTSLAAKLDAYDLLEPDAVALLARSDLEPEDRANLQVGLGLALRLRGAMQAAISLWRTVAGDTAISAGVRAWAWRNLSYALPPGDLDTIRAARASADAFLEDGSKGEAVTSLLRLFEILEHHSQTRAAAELESLLPLVNTPDLWGRVERAALHHALGNRFAEMRQPARSLLEAESAIALWRGVQGAEEELISSLHLAAMQAKAVNEVGKADTFEAEAKALTVSSGSRHFQLAERVHRMMETFDPEAAAALIADARATGEIELWSAAELSVAMGDPTLAPAFRLAKLEELHEDLVRHRVRAGGRKPVALAIAVALADHGDLKASAVRLQTMLDEDPGALDIRDRLAATLQRAEQWGDLALLVKCRLALEGEKPGLLTVYGQALLEAGDGNAALTALQGALQLLPADDPGRPHITQMRERALELGGALVPPTSAPDRSAILSTDLDQAFEDYRAFIAGHKRMTFWREAPDHTWVEQPERKAQDLLHTFLKARFGDRIEVFEEVGAGAGRMDLILRVHGGLRAIVELKLCGYGYSSSYAASGEDQIRHYMAARDIHLGYLVVHDARLTDLGKPLLTATSGADTVFEILIEVAPRMPQKRGRKRGSQTSPEADPAT